MHPLFQLDAQIGRGGMGTVWRGRHASGVPVAVKVLNQPVLRDRWAVDLFRNEVQAMAGMTHPGIAVVYDYGALPSDLGPGLLAGSPYVVLEWASGGSLAARLRHPVDWPTLRAILLGVLDALAHVHAAGVVHKDIKPANLLVCTHDDLAPGLKLCDFGIAQIQQALIERNALVSVAGTRGYMAPEQLTGSWRSVGPWTDLYAVGAVASKLATGRSLFPGLRGRELAFQSMTSQPPPFRWRLDVPDAFDGWLRKLVAPRPGDRYRCAAHACQGLRDLPELPGPFVTPEWAATIHAPPRPGGSGPWPSWRSRTPPSAAALHGTGLALFGMRTTRFVGRERERDALWAALRRVREGREPRAVVLRGPEGVGKTRLMRWIAARAHEVGIADVFLADPDEDGHGLRSLVERHLRTARMPGDALRSHIRWFLENSGGNLHFVGPLTSLLAPGPHSPPSEATYAAIAHLVDVASRDHVAIVCLDEIGAASEAAGLAEHLLTHGPGAVLVVIVPRAGERLAIEGRDDVHTFDVGPLAAAERGELVHDLLGLQADLARLVIEHTDGNPRFAVELVRDWVDRGVLARTPDGFTLQPGTTPELPNDLHAAQQRLLRRVLTGRSRRVGWFLEIAATLGRSIDDDEWLQACARSAGASDDTALREPTRALVDALVERELATRTLDGWAFRDAALRASLLRRAAEHGRLPAHHLVCADVVRQRHGDNQPHRLGHHLLGAGRPADAIDPLLDAAGELRWSAGTARAQDALHQGIAALTAVQAHPSDARWGRAWLLEAELCAIDGRFDEAQRWAHRVRIAAEREGWPDLHIQASLLSARVVAPQSRRESARILREVADLITAHTPRLVRHLWCTAHAVLATESGELIDASMWFQRGEAWLPTDPPPAAADFWYARGGFERVRGVLDAARDHLGQARALYERYGRLAGVGASEAGLADIDRAQGLHTSAERRLRDAIALLERTGHFDVSRCRASLGVLLVGRGDFEGARSQLDRAQRHLATARGTPLALLVEAALVPCAAERADWNSFDRRLSRLATLDEHPAQRDVAWCLIVAGDLAIDVDPRRAERAWRTARAELVRLRDTQRLRAVDQRLVEAGLA